MAVVLLAAGCSDDDEKSAQELYCEGGDSLQTTIGALTDLDLIAEGTNGLESALSAVQDDLGQLRDAATDAAADDVEELEDALDDFDSAVDELGGEISTDNVAALTAAMRTVGSAAEGVYATLTDCS